MRIIKRLLGGGAAIALASGGFLLAAGPASAMPRSCASYQASYNSAAYWSDFYYNAYVDDVNDGNYALAGGDWNAYSYDEQARINWAQAIMEAGC